MKKILVIVMLIFAFGCSDDATNPEPHELVGKWKTSFRIEHESSEDSVLIILNLEFFNNGTFEMRNEQPEEEIINEYGIYTISNDELIIENGHCAPENGRFEFEFKNNGVEFTRIEDECMHNIAFINFFEKYEGPFVSPNPIMNDVRE